MATVQLIRRQCLKWAFFPRRFGRTFGKRGRIKTAVAATLILFAVIAMVHRQKSNNFKRDISQQLKEEEMEKPQSPVRNIQEYVINNDVRAAKASKNITKCPRFPSALVGRMEVNQNITPSFEEVEKVSGRHLMKGGCFKPKACMPRQKVAILIPFKDREAHLKTLLYFLHPMLQKQKAHYCIYVAEQFDNGTFNKAMVMNAAFEEATKLDNYDCIVFHDVDMIPENDKNLYTCASHPRHLSPSIDKFKYKPHYGTDFGGVTAITPAQYRKANGHSNEYWGWGGEDNDMEFRIRFSGMKILAAPLEHGRYKMIVHKHPWKFTRSNSPAKLNKTREGRAKVDGLSDLVYRMTGIQRFSTYTKLIIDIRKIEVKAINLFIDGKPAMSVDVTPDVPCRWLELPGLTLTDHMRENFYQQTYSSLSDARKACVDLGVYCGGVVKERNKEEYSIHPRGTPRNDEGFLRNMVIKQKNIPPGGLGTDFILNGLTKSAVFGDGKTPLKLDLPSEDLPSGSKRTTHMRYCPAPGGSFQMVPTPIKIEFDQDIVPWVETNTKKNYKHYYKFEIDFQVILQPTKYLYYSDTKQFESQMNKGQNFYTFRWPDSKPPDFSNPETPREFKFKTEEFVVPNIPGCYTIRSRILDRLQHPYYEWNWWFEVKSDDRTKDAMAREEFWRRQMHADIIESKVASQEKEAEEKRREQEKREYLFKKEMAKKRNEKFELDREMEKRLTETSQEKLEADPDDKELDAKSRNIEVFNPKQGYPKIKNVAPKPTEKPIVVRDKVFHVGLPKHLKEKNKVQAVKS